VTERLGADGLRLALVAHGRTVARLRAKRRDLLPRSVGLAEFTYRGAARGNALARIELRPPVRGVPHVFRIRL
jgi:hypothetical protein